MGVFDAFANQLFIYFGVVLAWALQCKSMSLPSKQMRKYWFEVTYVFDGLSDRDGALVR